MWSYACLWLAIFASVARPEIGVQISGKPTMKHKVKSLPGVSGDLPNQMYTGYIDAGTPPSGVGKMYFHYWCVISASNAIEDPVLLWYNGGPGASSLFGLLQEFGPLLLTKSSYDDTYKKTGIPTPQSNYWAWTRTHTICAIDSPPPIGFSYCSEEGPAGAATSCGPWTDLTVFAANHRAHKEFFENIFPEFKSNPVYFVGESYGGIYIPGFAEAMMKDPVPGLNFKGLMVGDGFPGCKHIDGKPIDWCIDFKNVGVLKYPNALPGPYWDLEFFHGHSQMSTRLYNRIKFMCTEDELRGNVIPPKETCQTEVDKMQAEVGSFFAYNLLDACGSGMTKHGVNLAMSARMRGPVSPGDGDGGDGSACLGSSMSLWLSKPETVAALGVMTGSHFINLDNGMGFNYTTNRAFIGDVYQLANQKGLRVLLFEGDQDACGLGTFFMEDQMVPVFDSMLNQTQPWRPWTLDSRSDVLGGHAIEWDGGRFKFASIRGAGHMSSFNRPAAAFTLINAFAHEKRIEAVLKENMELAFSELESDSKKEEDAAEAEAQVMTQKKLRLTESAGNIRLGDSVYGSIMVLASISVALGLFRCKSSCNVPKDRPLKSSLLDNKPRKHLGFMR
eukprot:gnl/MRDRNA2_/MRDRNA2_129623_c0_seq1.p1 gnl/MRDRNA2_/MRDRNA2_129623_c0~~gnl/MRDRNA2_/MRDRNA2_129623_c0_seq1.p1  ORF type:complete len:616 (-),score=110.34 gnl/MRDRNA2_/MRDRNA2_129623_c0_seq1:62-1909(-)